MPRATPLRLLILETALPLLLVAAVEVGFAAYLRRTPTFPLPRLMLTSIDTGKYLAFRGIEERDPPLDVVFLGISPMMKVNGAALRDFFAAQGGPPFRSFSFAAPFHSVELDQRLLRDIVFPVDKPAVVVYGLTPINLLGEPKGGNVDALVRRAPAFTLQGGGAATWLRDLLLRNVLLLQYRDVLRDLATATPIRPDPWVERARQTDLFGDLPMRDRVSRVHGISRWEQKYVKRFASFDATLEKTPLFDHLLALATFCRDNDIVLVLLLNPVHPLFLDMLPGGRRDYDAFVARLRDTARQAGIPFFDPADGGIGRGELFQDTHHHNQAGAVWLSEQIARFLLDSGLLANPAGAERVHGSTID